MNTCPFCKLIKDNGNTRFYICKGGIIDGQRYEAGHVISRKADDHNPNNVERMTRLDLAMYDLTDMPREFRIYLTKREILR